jgi:hypothetical protein
LVNESWQSIDTSEGLLWMLLTFAKWDTCN